MFKDIPRANRDKAVGAVIAALAKIFIASFAFNEAYEKIIGRRPAFDPIDIMTAAIGRFSGWERNNLFDGFGGAELLEENDMSSDDALAATVKDVAEEIPILGGLLGGGRIPISGAIPNVPAVWKNSLKKAENPEMAEKANENIMKEVLKPVYYFIPPAGGGQAKKTIEGLVGGILTTAIVYTVAFSVYYGFTAKRAVIAFVTGAVCAVIGTVGDLSASMVKRQIGFKDYGKIMPGHGGLMDRFDSVLFVLPTFYAFIALFGVQ